MKVQTGSNGKKKKKYSTTLSSTSVLDSESWSSPSPEKETHLPLYRRLCGHKNRSGHVRNISPPQRFDPRTIHSVAGRDKNKNVMLGKNKPDIKKLACAMETCSASKINVSLLRSIFKY